MMKKETFVKRMRTNLIQQIEKSRKEVISTIKWKLKGMDRGDKYQAMRDLDVYWSIMEDDHTELLLLADGVEQLLGVEGFKDSVIDIVRDSVVDTRKQAIYMLELMDQSPVGIRESEI